MTNDFATASREGGVPVIDLAPLFAGDIAPVARQIHDAATTIGFFYVSNHGIPQAIIDGAFAASRLFFDMPLDIKQTVAIDTDQRGWMGPEMSTMQGAKTADRKEVFFWGREVAANDPDVGKPMIAPNRWPDGSVPCLREGIVPYYAAVCDVGHKVMRAVAVALGGDADAFAPHYTRPLARGQIVHYPPAQDEDADTERYGVAPHTDFGVLTLLLQDESGGLQVRRRDGEWIEAPPIPGTLVCNIGDLLQMWSNDRFVSTVHRVVNRNAGARRSIPVFYDPDTDAMVDPRLFLTPGETPLYPPTTPGEHISGRNRKSFSQYSVDEKRSD
jgi:isopenicillin N synthase-like dioxygenase